MANDSDYESYPSDDYEYTDAEKTMFLIGNDILPAIAHFLALFPTIPIDIYIVYRLLYNKIKKTFYFCIIMVMCALDVYDGFFGARDFLSAYSFEFIPFSKEFDWVNHQVLYYVYAIRKLFVLLIFINFKTSVKKKNMVDFLLYGAAIMSFILYYVIDLIVWEFFFGIIEPVQDFFNTLTEYTDYLYFIVYLSLATYCFIVLRRFKTTSYSSTTLKIYKRMAKAHYIMTALVVFEFIYMYPIQKICKKLMSFDDFLDYFIFPFGVFNYVYTTVQGFFRSILFYWALRDVIKVQSTPSATAGAALTGGPLFTRRATEGNDGVNPPVDVRATTL